jgi:hypothetical protein
MKALGLKICLFLFLVALFSGHTNALGALTGALTGTILLWPFYRRLAPLRPKPQRNTVADEDPARAAAE